MQGSPISPKLFTFVVDMALRDSEILTKMTVTGNLFAYADDLAATLLKKSHTIEVLGEIDSLKRDNPVIFWTKSKILTEEAGVTEACKEIGVEVVKAFRYLGVDICINEEDTVNAALKRCKRYSYSNMAKIKNITCTREERAIIQICVVYCHTIY